MTLNNQIFKNLMIFLIKKCNKKIIIELSNFGIYLNVKRLKSILLYIYNICVNII